MLGESIHSLTLALLSPPSPPIIVLYCTLTGNLSTREGSQSGELAVIKVYSTVKPDCCPSAMHRGSRVGNNTYRRTVESGYNSIIWPVGGNHGEKYALALAMYPSLRHDVDYARSGGGAHAHTDIHHSVRARATLTASTTPSIQCRLTNWIEIVLSLT